jgi:hypothetical protein
MRKFSKSEKENLIQLVVKADIRRLSLEETVQLIKESMDKDISINYISMLRGKVRSKGRQYIISVRKEQRNLCF